MNEQYQVINALREKLIDWEGLLSRLGEEQISTPLLSYKLSIKDVIAHLHAWQQVSIARFEAALLNKEPVYPQWTGGNHPDSEENLDLYNERIFQKYRDLSWSSVHQIWADGFQKLLKLAETLPEKELMEIGRYSWLEEYPLSAVLIGSTDHHQEHLEPLLDLFGQA